MIKEMNNEKFLVQAGLYDKVKITSDDFGDLINLLSGKQKIDLYCSKCKEKRTFCAKSKTVKMQKKETALRVNVFDTFGDKAEKDAFEKSLKAQQERELLEKYNQFLVDNAFTVLEYTCSREESHHLTFVLLIEGDTIQKIGQYPSYADIDLPQADIYRKELGRNYYNELKRAIGLYSCNVGIGSYVYLRRIVEKLILDALHLAINDGVITEEEFELDEKMHQRRVEDKIKLLESYLPKPLVENKAVYGIISKGIHELDEDECIKYFPVVEALIRMCLDESIERKRKQLAEVEIKKMMAEIATDVKGK